MAQTVTTTIMSWAPGGITKNKKNDKKKGKGAHKKTED